MPDLETIEPQQEQEDEGKKKKQYGFGDIREKHVLFCRFFTPFGLKD